MKMNKKGSFGITGFVIALITVSLFATVFGYFMSGMDEAYGNSSTSSDMFEDYTTQEDIINQTQLAQDGSTVEGNQKTNFIDMVGQFFSAGYQALKSVFQSFNIFTSLTNQAAQDAPHFKMYLNFIAQVVFIIMIVGIAIAILLRRSRGV